MIDINLIPPLLRKNGKEKSALAINIPKDILMGVGSGLVLLLLTVHLFLGAVWLVNILRLSGYNAHWQGLAADKAVLDRINNESKDLIRQTSMIAGMTSKKSIFWSPKLNIISDVLPRGLWIKKMTLDKAGLLMEGSVVSKTQNEINNVGLFLSALKQDDEFMKDFSSLEINSIQRGHNNAVEVTDFTVLAKLRS